MKNWKVLWTIIVILLVIIGIFVFPLLKKKTAVINDFESCSAAGYAILQSYPAQCITSDGRTFIEEVDSGQTACTQEAKLCPDGSSVGRTGLNCEFAPCPGEN